MLQSFYARAQYSKSKRHKFYDAKAVELVDRIDYDFSLAEKDSTMGTGVIARTIVFDELVKNLLIKIFRKLWDRTPPSFHHYARNLIKTNKN